MSGVLSFFEIECFVFWRLCHVFLTLLVQCRNEFEMGKIQEVSYACKI
jgi:hypothetical protein